MNTDTKKLLLIADSKTLQNALEKQLRQAFPQLSVYCCPADSQKIPVEAENCFSVFSNKRAFDLFM